MIQRGIHLLNRDGIPLFFSENTLKPAAGQFPCQRDAQISPGDAIFTPGTAFQSPGREKPSPGKPYFARGGWGRAFWLDLENSFAVTKGEGDFAGIFSVIFLIAGATIMIVPRIRKKRQSTEFHAAK
jgi:hypothetical protein